MSDFYSKIIENNKKWVETQLALDPDFFNRLKDVQNPPLLWIGCSDSRVPANQIIGAKPGEVFVHRNIANMVVHSDMNMLSVLDYSVNILKVKHIIVCGHYGCGGVKAAMGKSSFGVIDNWIRHIKDSYKFHKTEIENCANEKDKLNCFVEWNIKQQVLNLASTSIVQQAWHNKQELSIHGWVYGLETGLVKDLDVSFSSHSDLKYSDVYKLEFE
ncbi:MAG: carbonic anhydrase [Chitinophagales bacterium]|nr:carbonic anhydrase [Chitinophagales bacterium]MCO5280610.1 carbonic anhydrase [Chitinophagales bacterium]OJV28408.1 MAG: carbonic anhydrase [Bacteroidetes bacterium 37-13]HRN93938.1 carbonic anhydrase [Chitinophagales bacterium]HRP38595.1 carbonic anhydrase [Chitinophagales bacterium]